MKAAVLLSLLAAASATWWTYKDASEHPVSKEMLKHYRPYHAKWNYESSSTKPPLPHIVGGKRLDHTLAVKNAAPNHHKADLTSPYPKNLLYCLRSFTSGTGIPHSYNDQVPSDPPYSYWATQTYLSVGAIDPYGNKLALDSAIAVQERTLTKYGLNLYDAATWEMALALWNLHDVAWMYERGTLYTSTTGPMGRNKGAPGGVIDIRGDHKDFKYGDMKASGDSLMKLPVVGNQTHFDELDDGTPAKEPSKEIAGAFYYRIIAPKYQLIDPMLGNYANEFKVPWPSNDTTTPWNVYGMIHFNDWKPITGENVWSAMIGPIQTLYLATDGNFTNTTCGNPASPVACDFKTWETTPAPIQQAISILPAFKALLSQLGSIFHCPWGSKLYPYDENEGTNVSNENNFSAYAALIMLQTVLKNYTGGTSADDKLSYAIQTTDELVTAMDVWWDKHLLNDKDVLPDGYKVVPQGGHIIGTTYTPVPVADFGGLAVDCQTWGMTVLGAERVDRVYGKRMAYNIWQAAKKWAGYYKQNGTVLAGVGYTDLAGSNSSIVPQSDIWSAEWTFGAINMAQRLAQDYNTMGDAAATQSLMHDAQSMYNEVTKLWDPEDRDKSGLMFPDGSFVYANARFFIPWGWYANPISSLCSTSWSVMQARNFNPFELGGGNKPPLQDPPHLYDLLHKHQHAVDYE
eukprot:TRINITY_DN3945_c0_g1_i1.p1 TRINITY_DN3945_c0_g1~~TRINITY_DN3945_c0_g1_i1.p1  ORF type:complete len:686 (-),score=180.94 TRINITY_DN3945_c0_g1_i1:1159-3216(-)